MAVLFEQEYGVPKDMISLEVPMAYYAEGVTGRANIIIHALDEESNIIIQLRLLNVKMKKHF